MPVRYEMKVCNRVQQLEPFEGMIRVPASVTQPLPNIGVKWIYESDINKK